MTSKTFDEYYQDQQLKEDEWSRQGLVRELIERCARALARGDREHYHYVAIRLLDLDDLLIQQGERDLFEYDEALGDWDDWHWMAVSQFRDKPKQYIDQLGSPEVDPSTKIQLRARGMLDGDSSAKMTVRRAFNSYVCIAEHEGMIPEEMRDRADALEWGVKVGEHIQSREMDLGEEVRLITDQSGTVKILYCGGTGQGKSAAMHMELWAFYYRNFEPSQPATKIIDIMGFSHENWFYDIPQQHSDLRRIRRELGLPEDFTDPDLPTPTIEILHPLSPDLEEEHVPYDTSHDEFVVRPYTVAAADIPKPLLISLMSGRLTDQQAAEIETAYDEVSQSQSDWRLEDLITWIKTHEEMDAGVKQRAIHAVERLRRQSWIRTRECDWNLEWDEVMEDEDTITIFSQAYLDDTVSKLMAFGHLSSTIPRIRKRRGYTNECALVMRELWEVVPHNRRTADDDTAESLQKMIGSRMYKTFRRNRHQGIHILADTQKVSDLHIAVREMFNRYVIFNEKRDNVKDIFSWCSSDKWKSCYETLNQKSGQAAVIGQVGEAVKRDRIEYLSPIHYAPCPFHHWDRKHESIKDELRARVNYRDREELRRPIDVDRVDWTLDESAEIEIGASDFSEDNPGVDPQLHPVKAFVDDCIETSSGHTLVDDIRLAAQEYHEAVGRELDIDSHGGKIEFGNKFKDAFEEIIGHEPEKTEKSEGYVYENVKLNASGVEYLDKARGPDKEDAAESIRE